MRNRSCDCHRPKTLLSKLKRLEILRVVQGQARASRNGPVRGIAPARPMIVPKVGEPPDPGSASHFAFDGVGRVVESWRTFRSSPSLEGLSSVDDSLLPSSEGELLEALREGDLQAVKLQNAITQQVEKITAQVAGSKLNQFERAHYVYIY